VVAGWIVRVQVEMDTGFKEGRQFGRGETGGQVREHG